MKKLKAIVIFCVLTLMAGMQVDASEGNQQRLSEYASLEVGGVYIVNGGEVTGDVPAGAVYNAEENVLILTNYSYEAGIGATMPNVEPGISSHAMGEDFTIRLVGENTISAASGYADILVSVDEGIIEGPGTLNVLNVSRIGISYSTGLTIDGCTVNITGGSWEGYTYGIMGSIYQQGELVVRNSTININSSKPSGSTEVNFGIDTQNGNFSLENSEVNVNVTNGNSFGVGVGIERNGTNLGGYLTVNNSVIKCIVSTDAYVEGYELNWPMYFYGISSPEELNYYTIDGDSFVKSEFNQIFAHHTDRETRWDTNESVIISSYPLSEYCNHEWDEGIVKTEASCEQAGEMTYTCKLCGETKTEEVEALGHEWSDWTILKDASCTENGSQTRVCGRCQKVENQDIAALGHDYVTTIEREATCTENGVKQDKCSRCGDVSEETSIPAKGHSYGTWETVKEATFNEDGQEARSCTVCGDTDTRRIPKLSESHSHDFHGKEEVIIDANCTEEGRKKVYCTEEECGEYIEEVIPAKGHTEGGWETVKEASCSENGLEQKVCTICGTVLETRDIAKVAHTYSKWEVITEPTCEEPGVEKSSCDVCGEETYRGTEALGHHYETWEEVAPATCTEEGEESAICTRCGKSETRIIEALGHVYGDWKITKEATVEEEGQREAVCKVCGNVKTEVLPRLVQEKPVEIDGDNVQQANESDVPQTGDKMSTIFYIFALGISGMVIMTILKRRQLKK